MADTKSKVGQMLKSKVGQMLLLRETHFTTVPIIVSKKLGKKGHWNKYRIRPHPDFSLGWDFKDVVEYDLLPVPRRPKTFRTRKGPRPFLQQ
jgi:hypothetical protein